MDDREIAAAPFVFQGPRGLGPRGRGPVNNAEEVRVVDDRKQDDNVDEYERKVELLDENVRWFLQHQNVAPRRNDEERKEVPVCVICYDVGDLIQTPCNHGPFHDACLQRALRIGARCPLCRARVLPRVQVVALEPAIPVVANQQNEQQFRADPQAIARQVEEADAIARREADEEKEAERVQVAGEEAARRIADYVQAHAGIRYAAADDAAGQPQAFLVVGGSPDDPPHHMLANHETRNIVLARWKAYELRLLRIIGVRSHVAQYEMFPEQFGIYFVNGIRMVDLPAGLVNELMAFYRYKPHNVETFHILVAKCRELLRDVAMVPDLYDQVIQFAPLVVYHALNTSDVHEHMRLVTGDCYNSWGAFFGQLLINRTSRKIIIGTIGALGAGWMVFKAYKSARRVVNIHNDRLMSQAFRNSNRTIKWWHGGFRGDRDDPEPAAWML